MYAKYIRQYPAYGIPFTADEPEIQEDISVDEQETEWQVEQDDEAAIGSNLFYGSSMAEGDGSVYVLDIGMYGGKPVDEDERDICRMKEGEWEVFVSHYNNEHVANTISNVVYLDGYIYYVCKKVDVREDETIEYNDICRVSEEDGYWYYGYNGSKEWLLSCDKNFYIYEGEIYSKLHKEETRYFYKMKLNGEDVEELYSDNQEDSSDFDYTVGGGCLYIKDGEQILGINLNTGERKSFQTDAEHIEGMFYENDRLYIYDSENREVYQMDVRTGSESKLIEGGILADCVWLHDGYLYYVEGEEETEGFRCKLKAMDVMTGEAVLWESVLFDTKPCNAGLEVVGSRIIASFCTVKENETKEYCYFKKEIREITDAEYKKSMETSVKGDKEDEKKIIVIQEGFQDVKWRVEQDDEAAIGCIHPYSAISTAGNGCIYSRDMEVYDGEPSEETGEDNDANIYRLKEGKWELFASHPAAEEDPWWVEFSVRNLAYYNGYLYYILLRDYDPGTGTVGKDYSICRVPEQGGDVEELVKCAGNFFIYQDEIYYRTFENGIRCYFKMKSDGSDKERIYFDNSGDNSYPPYADYAVGGGCLYLIDGEKIVGINLETGIRKEFETSAVFIKGMFYEAGKLYVVSRRDSIIWQLDVKNGKEINITEGIHGVLSDEWIHKGYMYYVEWEEKEGEILYSFKAMNLATGERLQWDSVSFERHPVTCLLEVVDNQVIIRCEVYEKRYFKKEISEIMEMEWRT